MEISRSSSDSNSAIEDAGEVDIKSPIYGLATICQIAFKELLDILHTQANDPGHHALSFEVYQPAIEDANARFNAWGTNIAAFRDGSSRISLDYRMREAPEIKRRALQILEDVQDYLKDATSIINGERNNEEWGPYHSNDSSDYSEEDVHDNAINLGQGSPRLNEAHSELDDILNAVKASNASLMKLSIIIRSSANRDDYAKAASRFKGWSSEFDIGHVREKFRSAKYSSEWLVDRLGTAITRRRQFLKYRLQYNDRLRKELNDGVEAGKTEQMVSSAKPMTFVVGNSPQTIRSPGSDTGISFGSGTSYQPTILGGDNTPDKLSVPPPPASAFPDVPFEYGEHFQCPYCFTEQSVENKAAWKKHVFRDLKPYICTFQDCEMVMFESRNEWFAHELRYHRREWTCQFCQHPSFDTRTTFEKHVELSHPSLLATSSLKALILQSEEPVDKIHSSACPLCDDWESETIRNSEVLYHFPISPEVVGKALVHGNLKLFRRHLGRHMEQLALFALPLKDTEDSENENSDEGVQMLVFDKQKPQKPNKGGLRKQSNTKLNEGKPTENTKGLPKGSVEKLITKEQEKKMEEMESRKPKEAEFKRRLEEDLRSAGMDEKQIAITMKKEEAGVSSRPTYTRMSQRHLSVETLDHYRIEYEFDVDPDYILIKRWVPEDEQDMLWAHTRELRGKREVSADYRTGDLAQTEFRSGKGSKERKPSPSPLLTFLAGGKR